MPKTKINEYGETEDAIEATLAEVALQYGEGHLAARSYKTIERAVDGLRECKWWEIRRKKHLNRVLIETFNAINTFSQHEMVDFGIELFGHRYRIHAKVRPYVGAFDITHVNTLPLGLMTLCSRVYNLSAGTALKERNLKPLSKRQLNAFKKLPVTSVTYLKEAIVQRSAETE